MYKPDYHEDQDQLEEEQENERNWWSSIKYKHSFLGFRYESEIGDVVIVLLELCPRFSDQELNTKPLLASALHGVPGLILR